MFESIDHALFLTPNVATTTAPFARLGLVPAPPPYRNAPLPSPAVGEQAIYVGREHNLFFLQFLSCPGAAPGLGALALRVLDLPAARADLARRGVDSQTVKLHDTAGTRIADAALLSGSDRAGVELFLIQYVRPESWRYADLHHRGLLRHALPLRRLDHLAIVSPDLEGRSRYWSETLSVPLAGEVKTPTLLIRQHRIGDAIVELLGAAGPDSPIHQRKPGLVSMMSVQVSDVEEVAAFARQRGFHPSEPVAGPLTATRISTLPADEMSGLSLQLLQHLDVRGEPIPGRPALA